ncbi:Putative ripening-related protein 2 [Linum grandiflorum]
MIVALPTPFFEKGKRCFKDIVIQGNGRTLSAKVVDECGGGCGDNIVDASEGVWRGLNVKNKKDMGELAVTWFDA